MRLLINLSNNNSDRINEISKEPTSENNGENTENYFSYISRCHYSHCAPI